MMTTPTPLYMHNLIPFLLIACIMAGCREAAPRETAEMLQADPLTTEAAGYDSVLARQLGADDYGMKPYVIAFLKRGPNRDQDSATAAELQRAHLANIQRMADDGKLVIAGPFLDDHDIRGIYVFDVRTLEEAKALTETDPAIRAGRLAMDLRPWYGPAALILLNEMHNRVTKTQIK